MINSLPKSAILRSRNDVRDVFEKGKGVLCYPLRAMVLVVEQAHGNRDEELDVVELDECAREKMTTNLQTLFLVSKRYHKRAVNRNLVRRRMKEAHRLSRVMLVEKLSVKPNQQVFVALSYVSKEKLDYKVIAHAMERINKEIVNIAVGIAR